MVRPIIRGKSYVGKTFKSTKAVELTLSPSDCCRKIANTPTIGAGPIKRSFGYQSTVTRVILSASHTCRILALPTTEPGRRGWKRRLGSPISAPHFLLHNLTHPDHSPAILLSAHRIELRTTESIL